MHALLVVPPVHRSALARGSDGALLLSRPASAAAILSTDDMIDATQHSHHANAHHIAYSHSLSHSHSHDHTQHSSQLHSTSAHQPLKAHSTIHSQHASHMLQHAGEQQQQHNHHAQQNGHSSDSSAAGAEAIEEEVTSPASTSSSSSAASTLSSTSLTASTASATSPPHSSDTTSPPFTSTTSPSPPPLPDQPPSSSAVDELLTTEEVEEVLEATVDTESGEVELECDDEAQVKRVKVYQLNDVGQWDDKGTGQVSILHPHSPQMCIEVKAERDSSDPPPQHQPQPATAAAASTTALSSLTLLHHRIVDGQDYQRQGDTIITWCENSTGLDLALSFQDTDGCTAIWSLITALQQTGEAELVVPDRHSIGTEEEVNLSLPAVSVESLEEMVSKTTVTSAAQKDYMAAALLRAGSGVDSGAYMVQLYTLHRRCEEVYERSGEEEEERRRHLRYLELLFAVMRNLFLLNDANVIEWLVSDEHFMQTTALLEYDPAYSATPSTSTTSTSSASLPTSPSASSTSITSPNAPVTILPPLPLHDYHHHRSFLSSSCFLTFPSLSADTSLPSRIRQSYHLTYVKDVLLLRHLDDAALSTLSSMLFLNSVGLISRMNERRDWMSEVMELMRRAMSLTPSTASSASATTALAVHAVASTPYSADSSATSSPLSTPSTLSSLSPVSPSFTSPLLLLTSSASHIVSPSTHSLELIRRHIFAFLQELLILAKTVQAPLRDAFYRGLCEAGLLEVVEEAMRRVWLEEEEERRRWEGAADSRGQRRRRRMEQWEAMKEREKDEKRSMWVWITCTDMLTSLLMHDANIVRQHILPNVPSTTTATPAITSISAAASNSVSASAVASSSSSSLLSTIFSPLQSSHLYLGMGHQLSCILRLLLDPDTQSLDDDPPSSAFLEHIYSSHMPSLLTCLTTQPVSPACYHVIELLSFCVLHHGWLFPTWCARVGLFERLWQLVEGLSKHNGKSTASKGHMELVCSVIRLLRTCMATRELYYQQQLIADFSGGRPCIARTLLAHLFVLFYSNERYNLLNSSLIDLFLLIKADRLVLVMDEMMQAEGERLEHVSYVNVFAGIRYEWNETKMAMAKEKADEEEKARTDSDRHSKEHDKRRDTSGGRTLTDGEEDEDEDEEEEGLNGGEALEDEAEDGSKSSGLGDTEELAVDDEENGETEVMESWEKGLTDAAVAPSARRDEVRLRKRKSSGMDDSATAAHSSSSTHSPSLSSPSAVTTSVTVSSRPPSSTSSPLSIIITKSPTFSASPGSPPLTFSLSRVNNNHLPYSSSPGSPPLAPSPSSPRSPTSHILRARSPPPPTMGSPVRFTKSLGGGGGTDVKDVTMDVELGVSGGEPGELVDAKRRKTASF